jgi:DNA-binding NarL/FixJ family response regulator
MPDPAPGTAAYLTRPGAPLVLDAPTLADAFGMPRRRPPALPADLAVLLPLLADALSAKQIAARLVLSESAVKTRIGRLYGALHVHNRVGAVCAALACGLLDTPTTKEPDRG